MIALIDKQGKQIPEQDNSELYSSDQAVTIQIDYEDVPPTGTKYRLKGEETADITSLISGHRTTGRRKRE